MITMLTISALVYLLAKPYPDNLQNILLGLADVGSVIGLAFICGIYTISFDIRNNSNSNNINYDK